MKPNNLFFRAAIPDVTYYKKLIKCHYSCPVKTLANDYIHEISKGKFANAATIARATNPLAIVCGRICSAPCEKSCRRKNIDSAVQIRMLKRFALKFESKNNFNHNPLKEKIAVIGGGPVGISSAYYLNSYGYNVTIFESQNRIGGFLEYAIPRFRLTEATLKKEINRLLDKGVSIINNIKFGTDLSIDSLKEDGFKAIIIAIGDNSRNNSIFNNNKTADISYGTDIMKKINMGEIIDIGNNITVTGLNDKTLDIARSLIRTGKNVNILKYPLLNNLAMPEEETDPDRKNQAMEEGVQFHYSDRPIKIIRKNGRISGFLKYQTRGRRDKDNCQKKTDETFIETDHFIFFRKNSRHYDALIRVFDKTPDGNILVNNKSATSIEGVFASGDFLNNSGAVIDSIAHGKKVGQNVIDYLLNVQDDSDSNINGTYEAQKTQNINRQIDYTTIQRQQNLILNIENRKNSLQEVELDIDQHTAQKESARCLRCMINPVFDDTKCVLCGGCIDVCPFNCLKLVSLNEIDGDENFRAYIFRKYGIPITDFHSGNPGKKPPKEITAIIKDEDKCVRCGLCESRCPTYAITMKHFIFNNKKTGEGAVLDTYQSE